MSNDFNQQIMIWRVLYRTANENHNQKRPDIIMIFIRIAVKPRGLARGYKAAIR